MKAFLALGDSVVWGQGLHDANKFAFKFHAALEQTHGPIAFTNLAHSGAIIGWRNRIVRPAFHGEVPSARPSIVQQLESYPGVPSEVEWVLINGGINDVDIYRLLNPLLSSNTIRQLTRTHCGDDLAALLTQAGHAFPRARIFVVGYYPILSYLSDPFGIEALFSALHGVAFQPLIDGTVFRNRLVDHCLTFWRESGQAMPEAVAKSNQTVGHGRIVYVDADFQEANAVFAPESLLWGVGTNPIDRFPPLDEVIPLRTAACAEANLPAPRCFACIRASAGHPNVAGSTRIFERLHAAI